MNAKLNAESNLQTRETGKPLRHGATVTADSRNLDKPCRSCRKKRRRGAAAVEFAIVAPVFFLFVFGMVEYGRMVMVQQVLTNASREGARRAVLDGTTTSEVQATVNQYMELAGITGQTITVTPSPPSTAENGEPVTVEVSVPFSQVSWLGSPMFLGDTTLQARTVMRRESSE